MTHPRDDDLLQDLLDGRLEPAAAEEVRRRIAVEPDLFAAWEELRRLRDAIRALPAPAVPAGFLEGVRERMARPEGAEPEGAEHAAQGAPPPTIAAGVARDGVASPAAAPGPADAAPAPRGRVFRLASWPLAAAAGVLVAGLAVALATSKRDAAVHGPALETAGGRELRDESRKDAGAREAGNGAATKKSDSSDFEKATKERAADVDRLRADADDAKRPEGAPVPAPVAGAPSGGGPSGGYRLPGGAVPPGLREPSDPTAAPSGSVRPPAAAMSEPPPAPTAPSTPSDPGVPPPPTTQPPEVTFGGGPPAPSPAPGPVVDPGHGAMAGTGGGGTGAGASSPDRPGESFAGKSRGTPVGRRAASRDAFAWAREGVVEAYVMRAATLDEARARVALLRVSRAPSSTLGLVAKSEPPQPKSAEPAKPLEPAPAGEESEAKGAAAGNAKGQRPSSSSRSQPEAARGEPIAVPLDDVTREGAEWKALGAEPVVLGSFVLDLDAEARETLALGERRAEEEDAQVDKGASDVRRRERGARAGRVRIVVLAPPSAPSPAIPAPVPPPPTPAPAPAPAPESERAPSTR